MFLCARIHRAGHDELRRLVQGKSIRERWWSEALGRFDPIRKRFCMTEPRP